MSVSSLSVRGHVCAPGYQHVRPPTSSLDVHAALILVRGQRRRCLSSHKEETLTRKMSLRRTDKDGGGGRHGSNMTSERINELCCPSGCQKENTSLLVFFQRFPVSHLPAGGAGPRERPRGWEEGVTVVVEGGEHAVERPGSQHGPIKFPPMTSSHSSPWRTEQWPL